MKTIPEAMKAYLETHPFDPGDDDCVTVLDQIYLAYANSHESDPPEIRKGFEELEELLHTLPLRDNNAACDLCCRLCGEYEHKAFLDGERCERRQGREKGAERVAAVGVQRSRTVGKAHTGHRNRPPGVQYGAHLMLELNWEGSRCVHM